ncbi:hypothetical protein [Paenibacillus aestuarii]|uniref:Uncharacterized protein n=1 Tax=Paenibacillus aestuarii TaxID=516965 RepID=A0ABW0K0P9_9BACL|nr:hypothetical protein [Paenibacillus aestuarii]
MTKKELLKRFKDENIPASCYSLEGGLPGEKWCIGKTLTSWEVYYSERGIKSDLKIFSSEAEACDDLYNRIKGASKYW